MLGMKLAITICATEKYQYAMLPQARAIHANLRHYPGEIAVILAGDDKLDTIAKYYTRLFGDKAKVEAIRSFKQGDGGKNYQNQAQILIASMRTAAFTAARAWGADLCWSLDSDVIPKSSLCFRTLEWLLAMPGGVYEVAISPYPSQGGGDLLAGRGTPQNPIAQDFLIKEREVPADLIEILDGLKKKLADYKGADAPHAILGAIAETNKKINECPPKGNVFKVNAEFGWRARGWLSNAYPGLGRGSVVPSDWCGFGSTLLSRRALDEVDFLGYDGGGTEDLWCVWWRWHQVGIRIGAALHEPSYHVSRRSDGRYFSSLIRFVTDADEDKGEAVGHIRVVQRPFYAFEPGEKYDPENDGVPVSKAEREAAIAKQNLQAIEVKKEPAVGG